MRPIDGDALLEQMKHRKEYVGRLSDPECIVEDAPTVYVPQNILSRCRTCRFFVSKDYVTGWCSMFGGACTADDYCSRGAWIGNAVDPTIVV